MSAEPGWRLRRARAADAPALALIASATFLDTFAGILTGPDILAHLAANSSVERFAAYVAAGCVATLAEAAEGAAPLGYTLLTTPDLPVEVGPGDIELKRIYTLSRTHGSGLGAALMAQALADAAALGHARVLLGVYGANARARAFYERQGFTLAGTRRFKVGATWHDDVVYARAV